VFHLGLNSLEEKMSRRSGDNVLTLLPKPPVLITESADEFDTLHKALEQDIKPRGLIEHLYVADISFIMWEILRLRRCKAVIINVALQPALKDLLTQFLRENDYADFVEDNADDIARKWFTDQRIKKILSELLGQFQLDESAIEANAIRCLRQCGIRVWRMTAWGLGRVKTPLEERVTGRDFGWVAAFCQFAEFGEFSIGGGFVASLARPGGNVTGSTLVETSIAGKWLEVLKEIAPRVNRVAFLFNPAAAPYAEYYLVVFKAAAASLGMEAIAAPINKTSEIEPAIAELARDQNGGLVLMPDTFLLVHREEVTKLAGRYALPAI
jgi:hypothetical protein